MGLVAIQIEKLRLVKGLQIGKINPGTIAPVFYQPVGHFGNRQMVVVLRAEVPGAGILLRIFAKGGAHPQIAAEGFQDMLPGPDRMGAADADGLMKAQGADAIRNESVRAPVAAADDVTRPGGSGTDDPVLRSTLREKRLQISTENELRTALGSAVGVMAAQRVVFPVAPDPFPVFIAFIAGDVDQDFDTRCQANGLKNVDRAADVRVEGHFRLVIGEADEGLGSQVKDKFRLIFSESFNQPVEIAYIPMNVSNLILESGGLKIVGLAGRSEGVANDIRS